MMTTPGMMLQSNLRPQALQQWRAKKKREIVFFYFVFIFILFFFFFFQNYYKGYSLHDYKFKNIEECTT